MSEAFDKIAEGLNEALLVAQRDAAIARAEKAEAELAKAKEWNSLRALDIITLGQMVGQAESERDRLRKAIDQALDDMGKDGLSVCGAAKAQMRVALGGEWPDDGIMSYADALQMLIDCEQSPRKTLLMRNELAALNSLATPPRPAEPGGS